LGSFGFFDTGFFCSTLAVSADSAGCSASGCNGAADSSYDILKLIEELIL
jgi:hypothetical protein